MALGPDNFSYNGAIFDNLVSSKMEATPVLDDAKRAVKYVRMVFTVKGYISLNGQTSDATVADLRQRLSAVGKRFSYDNRGIGPFVVNDPAGPIHDVFWGPQPGSFTWTPLGIPQGGMFTWSVTICIPLCEGSVYSNALMMANYSVTYGISDEGLTTIAVSGAIEIPLTYRVGVNLIDNVDAYKERCFPRDVPLGFKRTARSWIVSNNRSRGEFSYTDTELPVAFPRGITMCDIKHRVRNTHKSGFTGLWLNEISGTVRTNPAIPRITALDRFLVIAMQRMNISAVYAQQQAAAVPAAPAPAGGALQFLGNLGNAALNAGLGIFGGPIVPAAAAAASGFLPQFFEITEKIHGLEAHFSVSYTIRIPRGLPEVVRATGLWTPTGDTFASWRASLVNNAHAARGTVQARYLNSEDTIIDLCSLGRNGTVRPRGTNLAGNVNPDGNTTINGQVPDNPGNGNLLVFQQGGIAAGGNPNPELTWTNYQTNLTYEEDENCAIHKPLSGTVHELPQTVNPLDYSSVTNQTSAGASSAQATVPDIVQRISSPSIRVILSGSAERVGLPIDHPELSLFGGQKTQLLKKVFTCGVVSESCGVPIFRAMWCLVYIVLRPPATLPVLANPMYPVSTGFATLPPLGNPLQGT